MSNDQLHHDNIVELIAFSLYVLVEEMKLYAYFVLNYNTDELPHAFADLQTAATQACENQE